MSKAKVRSKSFSISNSPQRGNTDEKIRLRAYQLYEERGRVDGRHEEDWLRAEAELVAGKSRSSAA